MHESLGAYIREKREAFRRTDSSYSLRQVAGRIGIEPSYLSKIERGEQTYLSEEKTLAFGKTKQKGLKFTCEFITKYEPKVGSMTLIGEVMYMAEVKKVEEILKSWKKDQTIPKDVMASVLNTVLTKSNIEAIILSQHVNLPPPIQLPKVESK